MSRRLVALLTTAAVAVAVLIMAASPALAQRGGRGYYGGGYGGYGYGRGYYPYGYSGYRYGGYGYGGHGFGSYGYGPSMIGYSAPSVSGSNAWTGVGFTNPAPGPEPLPGSGMRY